MQRAKRSFKKLEVLNFSPFKYKFNSFLYNKNLGDLLVRLKKSIITHDIRRPPRQTEERIAKCLVSLCSFWLYLPARSAWLYPSASSRHHNPKPSPHCTHHTRFRGVVWGFARAKVFFLKIICERAGQNSCLRSLSSPTSTHTRQHPSLCLAVVSRLRWLSCFSFSCVRQKNLGSTFCVCFSLAFVVRLSVICGRRLALWQW